MGISSIKEALKTALANMSVPKTIAMGMTAAGIVIGVIGTVLGREVGVIFAWAFVCWLWYDRLVLSERIEKAERRIHKLERNQSL